MVQSMGQTSDAESRQGLFAFDVTGYRDDLHGVELAAAILPASHLDALFEEELALDASDTRTERNRPQSAVAVKSALLIDEPLQRGR
jgi:hypothetical protein